MSGDHNEHQKPYSYLDFECPRCGHCCKTDLARVGEVGVWGKLPEKEPLMDREDIIRMAQEAISLKMEDHVWTMSTTHLERFAALVAAAERESCAKVCETFYNHEAKDCAAAIRARSEQ